MRYLQDASYSYVLLTSCIIFYLRYVLVSCPLFHSHTETEELSAHNFDKRLFTTTQQSNNNMNGRRNPGRQAGRFKGTPLYEQMGMMSISEGETMMSSGIQDFLGGNGSTPKRKSARDRRINAPSSSTTTTTTSCPRSKKPSQYDTTAESRSDERTASRSKSATGSARNTINSSSNTKRSNSFLPNSYQLELVDPHIALNGFILSDEKYDVSDRLTLTYSCYFLMFSSSLT